MSRIDSLFIGNFNIEDISVPLFIDISYNSVKFKYTCTVRIPKSYPDTNVSRINPLFQLSFSVARRDEKILQYIPDVEEYISIHGFYFFPREYNIPLTDSEAIAFRGFGKRCMCLVFKRLFESSPENDIGIYLEASGKILSIEDRQKYRETLSEYPREILLDLILEKIVATRDYPLLVEDGKIPPLSEDVKLDKYIDILIDSYDINLLADYYSRNFGLYKLSGENIYYIPMMGYLSIFQSRCKVIL